MNPQHNTISSWSLKQEINARLGDFDLISLLRLLKLHHYDEQSLWFSSHNNITSQNRLIESVNIDGKQGYAFIELNIGILASTGILPEHMRKFMDRPDVNEKQLQQFFQLYDHLLIVSYLGQLYPEINRHFFDNWQHTVACYTHLQNMRSKASLHWLLNTAFPEFEVAIISSLSNDNNFLSEPILGQMTLGEISAQEKETTQLGFKFYMLLRPEWNNQPFDWQVKTKERIIEWIIPWLKDFTIEVEFYLSITRSETHLKLRQQSVLGYDPFLQEGKKTKIESSNVANYTVLIHKQSLPEHSQHKPLQREWEDTWRIRV
jgi:hypothetical protein